MRRALVILLLAGAPALGACGGGDDKADADRTVREFVKATNERDADKFCDELVTEEFLEQAMGAQGDAAERQCRSQLRSLKGLDVKLVRIKGTVVKDDRARVTATLSTQGQVADQVLRLKKEDGRFKITGGAGG